MNVQAQSAHSFTSTPRVGENLAGRSVPVGECKASRRLPRAKRAYRKKQNIKDIDYMHFRRAMPKTDRVAARVQKSYLVAERG